MKLLTTYIDGECTPREAQLVGRLLRRSEEARALVARLEDDSQTLRSMPSLTIPIDLTAPVLAEVTARPPVPAPAVPPRHLEVFPVWRGVAAAAAVLLLVGLTTFWMSSREGPVPKMATRPVAPQRGARSTTDSEMVRGPKVGEKKQQERASPPPQLPIEDLEWPSVRGLEMVDPEEDDPPAKPGPSVITSGVAEAMHGLERVTLTLPTIHQVYKLDSPELAGKLLDQLASAKGFRLELLCRDGTRGLERLRAAMTAQKVAMIIDPIAQNRMKKPLLRSDYAVYLENVTPNELLGLVRRAAVDDRNASAKKPAEQRFEGALVVKPLGQSDRRELMGLIGLDPVRKRPTAPVRPAKVDITKPLSDLTDKQVGDSLRGAGLPRPGSGRVPLNAMVVPLNGPRAWTPELKRYLDGRSPAQPGTVQALIVLRQV